MHERRIWHRGPTGRRLMQFPMARALLATAEARGRAWTSSLPLVLILIAFLGIGLVYNVTVPVFEAPDENTHFAYARYLAETGRLPVQNPDNPGPWYQEGSQPPLYYAVVALFIRGIDTSDVASLQKVNPQNVMGYPAVAGNKNRFIHTDQEQFPYQGAVLAVHLARLVSLLMGAGTIWLSYLIARQIFTGSSAPALATAAFIAFLPQFVFISAAVNNDNAVTLLSTATLYILVRLFQDTGEQNNQGTEDASSLLPRSSAPLLLLGLVLGLGLLSKLSALLLVPFVVLALAVIARRRRSLRWFLLATGIVLGVTALVAGWWFLRNVRLYGDPVGDNVMMAIAARRAFNLERYLAGAWAEFRGLRWSFWGLFGWFSLPVAVPIYLVLDALGVLALLGLIPVLWRRARKGDHALLIMVAWVALVFGGLVWWTTKTKGAQGRLLFPAIAAIAVLFVAGWRTWLPGRIKRLSPLLVGVPMLAFATWSLVGVIRPAYAYPPVVSPRQVPPQAARPAVTFGERIRLLGVTAEPADLTPGDAVDLTLYWQALAPVEDDVLLNIRLFGHDMALLVNEDTYPGRGTFPPALWPVGPVVVDRYRFDLPADTNVPTLVRVDVGFVDQATGERWPAFDARGQSIPQPTFVSSFRLRYPNGNGQLGEPLAQLDDGIVLLDQQVAPTVVRTGESITVTLEWAAEAMPALDYSVFAHLIDDEGNVIAQDDGPPRQGDYPTDVWLPGDRVPDQRVVDVPRDAQPGKYLLVVGMYRLETLERLTLHEAAGLRWPDDAVRLPVSVRIQP